MNRDQTRPIPKVKILVADDQDIIAQMLKFWIDQHDDLEVVSIAYTGIEVIEQVTEHDVDLVLLDVTMPRLNGVQAIPKILALKPGIKILCLSSLRQPSIVEQVFAAGANGYLTKNCPPKMLMEAICLVMEGKRYLSEDMEALICDAPDLELFPQPQPALTAKEQEVLQLIAEGHPFKAIAKTLSITLKTFEKHRTNISKKLKIKSVAGLTKYAVKKGMTDLDH